MADTSVRVAVRVRPFNQREKDRNSTLIVEMNGASTVLKNPEDPDDDKKFTFDFSYWSHDGFEADDTGYTSAAGGSNYADQKAVMNDLGNDVLVNAWKGFNVSLFAYGQTGSGKSYSMVGYGTNKGIIPQTTDELYNRINNNADDNITFRVTVSMLEIYNETIMDLLNPAGNKPGGLKVREKPKVGVYVEGLTPMAVSSYADIERLMDLGTSNRTVASTAMNATSSRAHTVFTVMFTQVSKAEKKEMTSKINLIDLAGSERADSTGATGDRLKEGASINKSLSALGNVISALADQAGGKKTFVPYRNSVLTRLLQESLGGNAKTIMIAAVSPAGINFDESLSTLRYADRAKKIKNKAVINESPTDKLIRELKQENDRLKSLLDGKSPEEIQKILAGEAAATGGETAGNADEAMEQMKRELEENQKMMEEMQKSWEQKLTESGSVMEAGEAVHAKSTINDNNKDWPQLVNLHEDEAFNEKVVHPIKEGSSHIGRGEPGKPKDIPLQGLSIQKDHCTIERNGDKVTITPTGNARVFVNGGTISETTELVHNCTVILGVHHVFRLNIPAKQEQEKADGVVPGVTWEGAQKEFMEAQGLGQGKNMAAKEKELEEEAKKKEAEFNKKLLELEAAKAQEQDDLTKKLAEQEAAFQEKMKELQDKAAAQAEMTRAQEEFNRQKMDVEARNKSLEEEIEKQKQEKEEFEKNKERRKQDYLHLEDNLMKIIPMIREANEIAKELDRHTLFEVKLKTTVPKSSGLNPLEELRQLRKIEITVEMTDPTTNASIEWSYDKFTNRIFLMREMVVELQQFGKAEREQSKDPFWDPPEHRLIGTAHAYLAPLAYLLEIDEDLKIVNYKGSEEGMLKVRIAPVGPKGDPDDIDDVLDHYGEVEEDNVDTALLGKDVELQICVKNCSGIPDRYANDVFVKFDVWEDDADFSTPVFNGFANNPKFDYVMKYTLKNVTAKMLKWLQTDAMTFEVMGMPAKHIEVSKAARGQVGASPGPGGANISSETKSDWEFRKRLANEAGLPEPAYPSSDDQKSAVGCIIS